MLKAFKRGRGRKRERDPWRLKRKKIPSQLNSPLTSRMQNLGATFTNSRTPQTLCLQEEEEKETVRQKCPPPASSVSPSPSHSGEQKRGGQKLLRQGKEGIHSTLFFKAGSFLAHNTAGQRALIPLLHTLFYEVRAFLLCSPLPPPSPSPNVSSQKSPPPANPTLRPACPTLVFFPPLQDL